MMVNYSTNIDKTTSHIYSLYTKRRRHMLMESQVIAWDLHKYIMELNWLLRYPNLPLSVFFFCLSIKTKIS